MTRNENPCPPTMVECGQSAYDRLSLEIPTRFIGKNILFFQEMASTNDYARDYFLSGKEKAQEGTLIVAGRQTRGRGQFNRTWHSPDGGVYLSVLLTPPLKYERALPAVSLMAGAAAAEALENLARVPFKLKYPNDLFLSGKKVGGILVEKIGGGVGAGKMMRVILGMGVNLSMDIHAMSEDLRKTASSIFHLSGAMITPLEFIRELSIHLEKWYRSFLSGDFRGIVEYWMGRMEEIPESARDTLEGLSAQSIL